jgi:dTDP-4-dehydrorhamnose 3,5-epimerase
MFRQLPLQGSFVIDPKKNNDDRGFFSRVFCEAIFASKGIDSKICQINVSFNERRGTLRGLHYQKPPNSEQKIVRCISGSIWDVIVDLRKNSTTYGNWFGETLSAENRLMMLIPKGFAHGYISLEDKSEIIYFSSTAYSPNSEETLNWNDSSVQIQWPIAPIYISEKDKKGINLTQVEPMNI